MSVCTLTAVPAPLLADEGDGGNVSLRLMFSRDERRSRRAATPPRSVTLEGRRVLMPVDTEAGGTWIAASDAGLVFALLNVTPHVSAGSVSVAPAWSGRASRGTIIPALAGAASLADALARVRAIDPRAHAPFHLVVVAGAERVEARSDGSRLWLRRSGACRPWLRTSSSLGDRRVIGPRRWLFERWFRRPPYTRQVQDGFHEHRWRTQPALSVRMSRPDARTVSVTTVEVGPGRVQMDYLMV